MQRTVKHVQEGGQEKYDRMCERTHRKNDWIKQIVVNDVKMYGQESVVVARYLI